MISAMVLIIVWVSILTWAVYYTNRKRQDIGDKLEKLETEIQDLKSRINDVAQIKGVTL